MMMPNKRKEGLAPEKRKGRSNPVQRWWDMICGAVIGAMTVAAVFQIYEAAELRANPSLIGVVILLAGLLFLMAAGLIVAQAHYNPPPELPDLRQNPLNPTVIQQWDGQTWQDALIVSPENLNPVSADVSPSEKSNPHPSLVRVAMVTVATSLYGLFVSRLPRQ